MMGVVVVSAAPKEEGMCGGGTVRTLDGKTGEWKLSALNWASLCLRKCMYARLDSCACRITAISFCCLSHTPLNRSCTEYCACFVLLQLGGAVFIIFRRQKGFV